MKLRSLLQLVLRRLINRMQKCDLWFLTHIITKVNLKWIKDLILTLNMEGFKYTNELITLIIMSLKSCDHCMYSITVKSHPESTLVERCTVIPSWFLSTNAWVFVEYPTINVGENFADLTYLYQHYMANKKRLFLIPMTSF